MGPIIAAALTTPETRVLSVFAAGLDVTGDTKWDAFTVTDSGTNAKGTANIRIERTPSTVAEITDQGMLRVYDHSASGGEVFRGFIRARRPSQDPAHSYLDIIADDLTSLLDDAIVDVEYRPPESMRARLGYLWGKYAGQFLSGDLSFVQSIGGTLPSQRFELVSLRNAIEMVIAQASSTADYYLDMLGKLHVLVTESNDAPFNIDADAPGGGEIAPESLDLEHDSNSYSNRVFVKGASPSASGYFQDDAAIAAANGLVRTSVVQAPDCTTAVMARSLGLMYLGRVKSAKPRGSFTTTSPDDGWRAGQNVAVTSAAHGLAGTSYRIARVTTKVVTPGTDLKRHYAVEFGGARAGSGVDGVAPLIAGSTAGVYLLDQLGNAIISNAAAAESGGLGPALRRYLMSNVYNGDFYAPPPGPDAPVNDTTNPLPYWSFVQAVGTSVSAMSVLTSSAASGRIFRFTITDSASGDEGYIEQLIPVNGSQNRSSVYNPSAYFSNPTLSNAFQIRARRQYLRVDLVTTGGEQSTTVNWSAIASGCDLAATGTPSDIVPADAYFQRIRIGVTVNGVVGSTGSVDLHEVRVRFGDTDLTVVDDTDPTNDSYTNIKQQDGVLKIIPKITSGLPGASSVIQLGIHSTRPSRIEHGPQGCIAARNSVQSIPTGAWTELNFDATDITDPFDFHDPASNPSRFTVPSGMDGTYMLNLLMNFVAFTANTVAIGYDVNSAGAPSPAVNEQHFFAANATSAPSQAATWFVELVAGDYIEFAAYHNEGTNQNTGATLRGSIYYIGERT
jgi:hypothetical protein